MALAIHAPAPQMPDPLALQTVACSVELGKQSCVHKTEHQHGRGCGIRQDRGWITPALTTNIRFRLRSSYGHVSSGRLTTIGVGVLRTTAHWNASTRDGLISICGRKAGTWMKSPALAVAAYSPFAPHRTSQTPDEAP